MSDAQPLTHSDCDLRDFPKMMLEVTRLRRSRAWLIAKRRPELGFYMMNLWTASWHEVPAASLEDDDDVLADLAMCDPKLWPKVREHAMRGWIKCSDGRLYHPVVAEVALEAWAKKLAQRARTEAARLAKLAKRAAAQSTETPAEPTTPVTETVTQPATEPVTASVTESVAQSVTEIVTGDVTGDVTGSKGEGEGNKERKKEKPERGARGSRLPPSWRPTPENIRFAEELGLDAMAVAAKFRDFWCEKTGQDATKISWDGTWRNWCRRERPTLGNPQKPASKLAYLAEFAPGYGQLNIIEPETETLQ